MFVKVKWVLCTVCSGKSVCAALHAVSKPNHCFDMLLLIDKLRHDMQISRLLNLSGLSPV